jgi:hypothetical protein
LLWLQISLEDRFEYQNRSRGSEYREGHRSRFDWRKMSGNVNIATKSGSNQFHGSLYEINEASALDARNQFLTSKPRLEERPLLLH